MTAKNFPFNSLKAIQAFGILHAAEGAGRVPYYRLLKFLYIADRELIQETGRPIVGGRNVAMKKGPLSSPVYDVNCGRHPDSNLWQSCFRKDGRYLWMESRPDNDELSKREIKKLQEIADRYRDLDDDEVGDLTHDFAEYKKHYVPDTSRDIPLESLLDAVGLSSRMKSIQDDIVRSSEISRLFKD